MNVITLILNVQGVQNCSWFFFYIDLISCHIAELVYCNGFLVDSSDFLNIRSYQFLTDAFYHSWESFLLFVAHWKFLQWKDIRFCQMCLRYFLRWLYSFFIFKTTLCSSDKSHLDMVCIPFSWLPDSVCHYLIEYFYISIYKRF